MSQHPCSEPGCSHIAGAPPPIRAPPRAPLSRTPASPARLRAGRHLHPASPTRPPCLPAPAASAGKLVMHSRKHTGERPFPCEWEGCTYRGTRPSLLAEHVKMVHTGELQFVCGAEGCAYATVRRGALNEHMKTHMVERPVRWRLARGLRALRVSAPRQPGSRRARPPLLPTPTPPPHTLTRTTSSTSAALRAATTPPRATTSCRRTCACTRARSPTPARWRAAPTRAPAVSAARAPPSAPARAPARSPHPPAAPAPPHAPLPQAAP